MRRKNQDYAGTDTTVFGNLDMCDRMGWCSTELGILIRLMDKLARLQNIMTNDAAVPDETVRDICMDSINYNLLLLAKQHNRKIEAEEDAAH